MILYLRYVGVVHFYGAILFFTTIRSILEEPMKIHKVVSGDRRKIVEVAREVGLMLSEDFLNKYPHMLSYSQLQGIDIARDLDLYLKAYIC
uniref:Uncharacterized protein n=1 Tax=Ignisphaera aggregans TaxID=334771 RepID=A0A7J3MZH3_9CREN